MIAPDAQAVAEAADALETAQRAFWHALERFHDDHPGEDVRGALIAAGLSPQVVHDIAALANRTPDYDLSPA